MQKPDGCATSSFQNHHAAENYDSKAFWALLAAASFFFLEG
jgi:hypothetical protein